MKMSIIIGGDHVIVFCFLMAVDTLTHRTLPPPSFHGKKRSISTLQKYLHHQNIPFEPIRSQIHDIVIKTMMSVSIQNSSGVKMHVPHSYVYLPPLFFVLLLANPGNLLLIISLFFFPIIILFFAIFFFTKIKLLRTLRV